MADDEIKATLNQIASVLPTLATKKDLEAFARKEDLEAFAKKEDLVGLATKKDLEQVKAELEAKIDVESRVINARLDEQGRILAAMIPTRIAAVPPAAE